MLGEYLLFDPFDQSRAIPMQGIKIVLPSIVIMFTIPVNVAPISFGTETKAAGNDKNWHETITPIRNNAV